MRYFLSFLTVIRVGYNSALISVKINDFFLSNFHVSDQVDSHGNLQKSQEKYHAFLALSFKFFSHTKIMLLLFQWDPLLTTYKN